MANATTVPRGLKSIPESARLMSLDKAYILGVICGDAYASFKHKYVMLETISREFIDEFRRCIISVYGKNFGGTVKPTCNGKERIVVCGKMMTEDIRRYLPKQRSFEWRVPEEIKNADTSLKAVFMKGFFDSEGSVNKHHSMELHSANWNALNEVKCLLLDLSIETSDIKNGTNAFVLYITSKRNIVRFIFIVGTNIQRKYDKMLFLLKSYGVSPSGEN